MSIEQVKSYLKQWGWDENVIEFAASTATVELAAAAVGTLPERIAKSLSFLVEDTAVIVVVAGDAKVDNRKYKDAFGKKAKMLTSEQVTEMTGHVIGGVCPFALPETTRLYLDVSLKRFEKVYPAAGTPNSCIGLSIEELEICTPYLAWVDVCKGWQEEAL